ncbi:MAG: hypothetical protein MI747_04000 [Desulfobacterales bacterium]|nr:hypothetical protein [Desulfobacterales bacterium]
MDDILVGKSAVGIKNVTANEPYFAGHFPHWIRTTGNCDALASSRQYPPWKNTSSGGSSPSAG